jgi:hypothetical protein
MSRFIVSNKLRTLLLGVTLSAGFLAASVSTTEAQRVRPARAAKAKPAAIKKAAVLNAFKAKNPGASILGKIGKKQLLTVPTAKSAEYTAKAKNSVEVIFTPHSSQYGHIWVRVGNRIFDLPGPHSHGRNKEFRTPYETGYGFVHHTTPKQIEKLQRGFDALIAGRPKFSEVGGGQNNTFSCASFVTSVLQRHAPELNVNLSMSAVSVAKRLLTNGSHDAVTLYGDAINKVGNANFEFTRL